MGRGPESLRSDAAAFGDRPPLGGVIRREDLSVLFGVANCEELEESASAILRSLGVLGEGQENIRFLDEGKQHEYKTKRGRIKVSEARYFFEDDIGEHAVYVAFISPGAKTTRHWHEPPIEEEIYVPVRGSFSLYVGGETCLVTEGQDPIIVPPNTVHQATGGNDYSVSVIVMKNAGPVPKDARHKIDPSL